jgi:drug/metabolite transporter (DMT)-like permease
VVWALTMLIPAGVVLIPEKFAIDHHPKAIFHGMLIGLTGAGGTVALFEALSIGPAYLIFPILALSPVITVSMAAVLLGERTGGLGWIGVVLALISIVFFSMSDPEEGQYGSIWLAWAVGIMIAWGIQAYLMKIANRHMTSASIFFYMMLTGLMFIPLTIWMTDFEQPIHWGASGPGLAAVVQLLNAIGACTLVFALRDGKAIIVSPMCNALAFLITVMISLLYYQTLPSVVTGCAIALAIVAAFLMVLDEERSP